MGKWRRALENMGLNRDFWKNKRILITGHTGFKGSWLSFWLNDMGARLKGIALPPDSEPDLYSVLSLENIIESKFGDIRDKDFVNREISVFGPEIIIHLAAQAIVRRSYIDPLETFETNVLGTANILNSARNLENLRAFVSVTSDKCYENREWEWKYRESDSMGGLDPYSASKGCAELITSSFRRSFFQNDSTKKCLTGIASVRAGNVIGGGDWSDDRLIPDCIRNIFEQKKLNIRNPHAIRPWQNILDLLRGYMILAEKLYHEPEAYSGPWNFGPSDEDEKPVGKILEIMAGFAGDSFTWYYDESDHPHEASYLKLDSSKARTKLGWSTILPLKKSLEQLMNWYKKYYNGEDMVSYSRNVIREFEKLQSDSSVI